MLSRYRVAKDRDHFRHVRSLCLTIGHTKSGGTLLGSLLDAHPRAAIADETDALRYLSAGFQPDQVYWLLEKGARRDALKGNVTARRLSSYSFSVPDQWQGRVERLEVVGDCRAGIATQRFGADPGLVDQVAAAIDPARLQLLHVVRNPFDPMSAMMIRGGRSFDSARTRYFANCDILLDLHERVSPSLLRVVPYEDMVDDTVAELRAITGFLGLAAPDPYLRACAAIIEARPPERTLVDWSDVQIDTVEAEMGRYPFLEGYSFDDHGRAT